MTLSPWLPSQPVAASWDPCQLGGSLERDWESISINLNFGPPSIVSKRAFLSFANYKVNISPAKRHFLLSCACPLSCLPHTVTPWNRCCCRNLFGREDISHLKAQKNYSFHRSLSCPFIYSSNFFTGALQTNFVDGFSLAKGTGDLVRRPPKRSEQTQPGYNEILSYHWCKNILKPVYIKKHLAPRTETNHSNGVLLIHCCQSRPQREMRYVFFFYWWTHPNIKFLAQCLAPIGYYY